MGEAIRIGIIGDFEPAYHSHFATNAALYDAATKLKVPLELRWPPTPSLEGPDAKNSWRVGTGLSRPPGVNYPISDSSSPPCSNPSFRRAPKCHTAFCWHFCEPRCISGGFARKQEPA